LADFDRAKLYCWKCKKYKFQGGVFAVIKVNNIVSFYYGDNSWWLIDDWEREILNDTYFNEISPLKIEFFNLKNAYRTECLNHSNEFCSSYLPSLYVDFDNKELYNNFYDQALENRVIEGWKGFFIENKKRF